MLNSPPPSPFFKLQGPRIEFPLPDDNVIEIQLRKPVSKRTFERIKQLLDLSEDSLVAEDQGAEGKWLAEYDGMRAL
jgi:hypothetical protein